MAESGRGRPAVGKPQSIQIDVASFSFTVRRPD
jgi:hypothetical protein